MSWVDGVECVHCRTDAVWAVRDGVWVCTKCKTAMSPKMIKTYQKRVEREAAREAAERIDSVSV